MECRICSAKCESDQPQYQSLCRACGQKRELYASAALTGLILSMANSGGDAEARRNAIAEASFRVAETMVRIDRLPK